MAKAAALAKGSVHWVLDVKVDSGRAVHIVTDAGRTQGEQIITGTGGGTVITGLGGTGTNLLVSAQMGYLKGDATFLGQNLQVPRDEATKYAGRWIAVPSYSSDYAGLASWLTVSSLLPGLEPTAPLRFTKPTTINGKNVVGVSGNFPTISPAGWVGTQVFYVSTAPPYLPIAITQDGIISAPALSLALSCPAQHCPTASEPITEAIHLSDYGESVVVKVPAKSIPISSIPGTS
jgi:hypothetical protein